MTGLGLTCGPSADLSYPAGCPTGFTLQPGYYLPHSQQLTVPASTPGALPSLLPNGCPQYYCTNSQGQSAVQLGANAAQSQCNSESIAILGLGILGLIFLPGWTKLIAVWGLGASFAGGLSTGCFGGEP